MSEDPRIEIELNPQEQRVYDRFRSALVTSEAGTVTQFSDLLLLLPDLAVLLMRMLRDDRVPLGSKAIALAGVAYLFAPIDLFPVVIFGPLGLVDDLFVLGAALSRLINRVHPDVVRSHWSGKGDALEAIHRVTRWSETQMQRRVADVRRWLPLGR